MKQHNRECSTRWLALRSLIIILLVLLALGGLKHLGVIGTQQDLPPEQVEEAVQGMASVTEQER